MAMLSPRPLLPTLIPSLNALLSALSLPFALEHPTDLTPSLLLAIFESVISARLPIPLSVRQSRTRDAKARAMLVLLGVLECDVLRGGTAADPDHSVTVSNADDSALGAAGGVSVDGWVDEIGLGEVDPERLADGGWEETVFVGELLCWLARRKGILPRARSSRQSSRPRSFYLNHHSYGTEEGDGDTADFSTSLLLQPSSARKSQPPRSPSPTPTIDQVGAEGDFSLSYIADVPRHPLVHSPEPSLSASATTGTDLSIRARSISSRTSISNTHDDDLEQFEEALQDTLQIDNPVRMMQDAQEDDDLPPSFHPRCIHELEDPSYIRALAGPSSSFNHIVSFDPASGDGEDDPSRDEDDDANAQDNDNLYAPPTPTPRRVRLTGWIEQVDPAAELNYFSASRSHSSSRTFHTSSGSGSDSPSESRSQGHTRTSETSKSTTSRLRIDVSPRTRTGTGKPRTSHRKFPSPLPSPSPSPPLPTTSSKHTHPRFTSSPPPSPPSPAHHSDALFDVSFSTLNNTSTPAKPRPSRRPRPQTATHHEIKKGNNYEVDLRKDGGSTGTGHPLPLSRRLDRSPSYTPSPPSFSTPGSLRGGGSGVSTSAKANSTVSSATKTRPGGSAPSTMTVPSSTATSRNQRSESLSPTTMPPLASVKGKLPPPVQSVGSTATTNALLTERARLLTELAALKRARAASGENGAGTGGIVGRRVGVGG